MGTPCAPQFPPRPSPGAGAGAGSDPRGSPNLSFPLLSLSSRVWILTSKFASAALSGLQPYNGTNVGVVRCVWQLAHPDTCQRLSMGSTSTSSPLAQVEMRKEPPTLARLTGGTRRTGWSEEGGDDDGSGGGCPKVGWIGFRAPRDCAFEGL